jgi:pyridoxamine 5'-phosphate oxidase
MKSRKKLSIASFPVILLASLLFIGLPLTAHGQAGNAPGNTMKDCIDFVEALAPDKTCSFATVDGDQPRVRMLAGWFVDQKGFYFQTETPKAFYKQMQKNPKVEVVFYNPKTRYQLRASGKVEFLDDLALKAKVIAERPYLKQAGVKGPDDPLLAIFRIVNGEAYFWTFKDSMKEDKIPRIKF